VAAALPELSRTEVQRLIKAGLITVDGKPARASHRVMPGDRVIVTIPAPQPQSIDAELIPLDVIYEDADLAAINKPAGMVVHPAAGNRSGTVVNAALARWPEMRRITGEERAGVVHRLDKDTSGVLVLAKTPAALKSLQQQFKQRTVYKRYIALVEGVPESSSGLIEAAIGRDTRQRRLMAVVRDGRPAVTRYDVIEHLGDYALLSVEPHTGRTHQIRVHLAWLGHPVVGDTVYGRRKQRIRMKRLFLHAAELQVDSPSTGARLTLSAPLPGALEDTLAKLRRGLSGWE
jgi:23S rRNA pseudouridine1911/1915/1917 synthase